MWVHERNYIYICMNTWVWNGEHQLGFSLLLKVTWSDITLILTLLTCLVCVCACFDFLFPPPWKLFILTELMQAMIATYLLYNTMSGSQICSDGTYSLSTPPYSEGTQVSFLSIHSYGSANVSKQSRKDKEADDIHVRANVSKVQRFHTWWPR